MSGRDAFTEWNKLYGKGSTKADKLRPLLRRLPNISTFGSGGHEEEEDERSSLSQGLVPSLGLFGESREGGSDGGEGYGSFLGNRGSSMEKYPVKEVVYIPDTDIEPVTIVSDLEDIGNDRVARWKYMKMNLEYYLKSKYRLSAYTDVLGDMMEIEMEIRIKGIPVVIPSEESEEGFITVESTNIHRWGEMYCVDTSTEFGQAASIALRGITPEHDLNANPTLRSIYEHMLDIYLECERYNSQDHQVLDCMNYILRRLEDSLIKASRACQCLSCYTQTRDDQDNEMREIALARYAVDQLGMLESKYCQVHPKDYANKEEYRRARKSSVISPEMDWIWGILKDFSGGGGKGAGGFAGISFQRNTAFVSDLTECCVFLWTAFSRLWFLAHLDEYVQCDTVGKQLKTLYCMVIPPKKTTSDPKVLEELFNRTGSCPILDFDTPVMLYDLHTTMLSIAEMNSNLLECPLTPDLIEYAQDLYGRYSSFTWFMFTEEDLMNALAYVKSIEINESPEDEEQEEAVVLYTHINKFFLRYGWNMLFPCLQMLRIVQSIESLLQYKFYLALERTMGKSTGMNTEIFDHAKEWGHQYITKESARIACEQYNAEVIQYMLRPGEMKMFKLKHDRGDTHPMNVINNLRPHDMDRFNKSLLNSSPDKLLDVNMFPLRLSDRDMIDRGRQRAQEAKEQHQALSSLMRVEGISVEWEEVLRIMQSGVDVTGKKDTYENSDTLVQLDRIVPYGTRTCNDYLYYRLFISLCYDHGSVVKFSDVIFMREVIEYEIPKRFSMALGIKITSISSPHNMKQYLKKSPVKREKLHRVTEYPEPILCQLAGGYSVIWFSSDVIYHCESFIEALFYLSVCSLRNKLDCCIHGKFNDIIIGDIDGGECKEVQEELETIMKDASYNSGTDALDIRDVALDTFKRERIGIFMRTAHDLIECTERSETGIPAKWENDMDVITFWYYVVVHIFGVFPAIDMTVDNLFSSSEDYEYMDECRGEGEGSVNIHQADI